MKDIKTRKKSIGTIRMIDRASMLSYRMKQAALKAKDQTAGFRSEDERNESAYAEEHTLSLAGSGAVVSGDVAVKSFKESWHVKGVIGSRVQSAKATDPKCNFGSATFDPEKEYENNLKTDNIPTKTVKVSYPISNGNYNKTPINTINVPGKHIKSETNLNSTGK